MDLIKLVKSQKMGQEYSNEINSILNDIKGIIKIEIDGKEIYHRQEA